jgi:2-keto-4-pentenoate hydratase/2-oxohepta-3-ene-1,7-dioic acid hydratase in catechol pathway
VAGYTVANDLTARSLQKDDRARGHPWLRAKNLDGFCPLGPCLVPRDALDVSDLRVTARVRVAGAEQDELRQDARTRDLVVDVPQALAWLSRHLTLRRGDLVLMGTPAGVGPLGDGDRVVCAVEGIGDLETLIHR